MHHLKHPTGLVGDCDLYGCGKDLAWKALANRAWRDRRERSILCSYVILRSELWSVIYRQVAVQRKCRQCCDLCYNRVFWAFF